jgi:hypothetical protein
MPGWLILTLVIVGCIVAAIVLVNVIEAVHTYFYAYNKGAENHRDQINYPNVYRNNYSNDYTNVRLARRYNEGWASVRTMSEKKEIRERNKAMLEGKPTPFDPNDVIGEM